MKGKIRPSILIAAVLTGFLLIWAIIMVISVLTENKTPNEPTVSNTTVTTQSTTAETEITTDASTEILETTSTEGTDNVSEYKASYFIISGTIGEFGRIVTLNANTDMPSNKELYKFPSGTYEITTSNSKYSTFSVVKDKIVVDKSSAPYSESLEYVGSQYTLTAGNDLLNGKAQKSVKITLADDESLCLNPSSSLNIFLLKE